MPPPFEPGSMLADRYRLERILGEGGMGVVWAATHIRTQKPVALKLVRHAADSAAVRTRLLREARAASAVRHPNVCEVHDVVELDDGAPVMVMEYLVGEPLAARLLREGQLSIEALAPLFAQVLSAVGAAHALGIIHRDLKPENIFVTSEPEAGRVKVLDFGIAKLTAEEGAAAATTALTATGALLGTPYYMSPEQTFGEKEIDQRADVWALGLILYRALTGVLPTDGENVGQVFKNIVARPIRPLAELAPDVPADVAAMTMRMLSRARRDRPADLHEVLEVIARYTDVRVPDFGAPASRIAPGVDEVGPAGGGEGELRTLVDPMAATAADTVAGTAPGVQALAVAPPPRPSPVRPVVIAVGAAVLALAAGWALRGSSGPGPAAVAPPTLTTASAPVPTTTASASPTGSASALPPGPTSAEPPAPSAAPPNAASSAATASSATASSAATSTTASAAAARPRPSPAPPKPPSGTTPSGPAQSSPTTGVPVQKDW